MRGIPTTGRLRQRIISNIGVGVDADLHTYGIRFDKAPDRRVIVSELVVVESGLGVVVLAWVTQVVGLLGGEFPGGRSYAIPDPHLDGLNSARYIVNDDDDILCLKGDLLSADTLFVIHRTVTSPAPRLPVGLFNAYA